MLRALIFDFDGTILDTESADYACWQAIYRDHDCELPLAEWQQCIGTAYTNFNPYDYLEAQSGRSIDRTSIAAYHKSLFMPMVEQQATMPGIDVLLNDAADAGLRLAVASSSQQPWVTGHLDRLGLLAKFHTICTASDVQRIKPAPDLYLLALERLDARAEEALAVEDSLNGMNAALAAGLTVVVVPNPVTSSMRFDHSHAQLESLKDVRLAQLAETFNNRRTQAGHVL
jgi:HAD superfamily hydrolase (TIGR01509 family)